MQLLELTGLRGVNERRESGRAGRVTRGTAIAAFGMAVVFVLSTLAACHRDAGTEERRTQALLDHVGKVLEASRFAREFPQSENPWEESVRLTGIRHAPKDGLPQGRAWCVPFRITSRQERFVVAFEDLRRPAPPLFEQDFENMPEHLCFALVLWSDADRSTWSLVSSDGQRGATLIGAGDLGQFEWPSETVDSRTAGFVGSSWHWSTGYSWMSLALYDPCEVVVSFNGDSTDILAETLVPRPGGVLRVNRIIYREGSALSKLIASGLPLEQWPEPVWRISVRVAH
ncbi:MAG: hypothetical protein NTV21_19050 [Planctomycetota bacterium]|nr:hypothetical protein [Planctomycetota bacterium]